MNETLGNPAQTVHRIDAVTNPERLTELFARFGWFRSLSAQHQECVLASSHAAPFDAGRFVASRRAPSDFWIGVASGLVKLAIHDLSGRSCTLSGVPPGGWFGEGSVIKKELRKYDVVTLQPSLMMFVPSATFHTLLDTSLPFNHFVIRQLNNRMGEFIGSIQCSRLLDVDARVAQSLVQMLNPDLYPDTGLALSISQEELGLLAGVSRQRVNQALQVLEDSGLLRRSYNEIRVLNLERLREFGRERI
jgi:CRP/FNR family transcriptional regulator, cyclic AMP receptor protein